MNDLANPLTPADCDLRDFGYMPVDVQRVCDSDLAALETPEACWAAFLLWCKSWHQVPAASLPDDDRVLAKFTGYQRAPDAWQAIREGAMRGWIKCADGRLYHPVVAEKANEAWFAKHRRAHDQLIERVRKRNKVRAEASLDLLEVPPLEQWIDMGRPLEKTLFPAEFSSPSTGKRKNSTGNGSDFRRKEGDLPPENNRLSAEDFGADGGASSTYPQSSSSDARKQPNSDGSAGTQDSSAGKHGPFRRNDGEIPPENALKGEERRGKGEVNTIGSNDDGGTAPRPREIDGLLTAVGISTSLIGWERERGKAVRNVTPSQQQVVELAQLRVSPEELRKAYDLAVADRLAVGDPSPVNAGFVRSKLEQARRPAAKPRDDWHRSDAGISRKASELGIVCPPGKDFAWLREKCESELRRRAQGVAA